ncbi:small heat shock protein [Auricularia subglabra TFB-10046 SS5]|uniref:Small heat shock protein n=1 Tax=Auricularia subglabra (strain TFB-10046 / SS5) TaxID=717982 RepID=J0WSW5_AURST|nr:small heat shock protein [Auricularia subglabra TFB-10046 SS5]
MSLIWTSFPFDDVDRFFDDAFNGVFPNATASNRPRIQGSGDSQSQVSRGFRPGIDVHEDKEKNLVTASFELPGLKKDDITIDVHNGRLTVSGRVETSSEETKDGYVVRERRSGNFSRAVALPNGVKAEDISAALNDGVLTVTWPKTTAEQQAKRIAIN